MNADRFAWLAAVAIVAAFLLPPAARPEPPHQVPVLLDTDIGDDIDDAFALALLLSSPEVELRGITTVHGDAHTRALLVCRLLDAVGHGEIPVASGRPPHDPPESRGQLQYGLRPGVRKRPERELAVGFLYRKLKEEPGRLTLLAIGPLTNVGDLLTKHPDCKPWIKRIVLMGGAVHVGYKGKPPPEPEWNVKSDVAAARTVFTSGVPLVVVPLDATADVPLPRPQLDRILGATTPLGDQLHALYRLWDGKTPTLFDPVAAAGCVTEQFCTWKDLRLEVDDKGQTRAVDGAPNARVALSIRRDEFLTWFTDRLTRAAER